MNRILFRADEVVAGEVVLHDRRARHIREVLQVAEGAFLRVGVINGQAGRGRVVALSESQVKLALELDVAPLVPWFDLLLALPRPKVLKRLWAQLAAFGVRRITILNATRVERYYFDTHWLRPENYTPLLIEGLEQGGGCCLPEVVVERRFKLFVEERLIKDYGEAPKFLAHPADSANPETGLQQAAHSKQRPLLAVGPEGGWSEFELELLTSCGFVPLALGPWVLRSDTAAIALAGRLSQTFLTT